MTKESYLKGKKILVVDDETDILEIIAEILEDARIETAQDYESASAKIRNNHYDIAILDIMGVNGLRLLEETVAKQIPTIMLTAHAINAETLIESIRKGAISYLPKEKLVRLDDLLNALIGAYERGEPPWKLLFDEFGDYFDKRFGPDWQETDTAFWREFNRSYTVGRGIQQRLLHHERVRNRNF